MSLCNLTLSFLFFFCKAEVQLCIKKKLTLTSFAADKATQDRGWRCCFRMTLTCGEIFCELCHCSKFYNFTCNRTVVLSTCLEAHHLRGNERIEEKILYSNCSFSLRKLQLLLCVVNEDIEVCSVVRGDLLANLASEQPPVRPSVCHSSITFLFIKAR